MPDEKACMLLAANELGPAMPSAAKERANEARDPVARRRRPSPLRDRAGSTFVPCGGASRDLTVGASRAVAARQFAGCVRASSGTGP